MNKFKTKTRPKAWIEARIVTLAATVSIVFLLSLAAWAAPEQVPLREAVEGRDWIPDDLEMRWQEPPETDGRGEDLGDSATPACARERPARPRKPSRGCFVHGPGALSDPGLKPDFARMAPAAREAAFIEFIAPWAIQAEEYTRIPASVIIAQAALETGYGTSVMFRKWNGLFGLSCRTRWAMFTYSFSHDGTEYKYTGQCGVPRPSSEGLYYVAFRDPRLSVLAYSSTLLGKNGHEYYPAIQKVIEQTPKSEVVSWRPVVKGLTVYSKNEQYPELLINIILKHQLYRHDLQRMCW